MVPGVVGKAWSDRARRRSWKGEGIYVNNACILAQVVLVASTNPDTEGSHPQEDKRQADSKNSPPTFESSPLLPYFLEKRLTIPISPFFIY